MANQIPNFDAMTRYELMDFCARYPSRPSRKAAAALIGDTRKGYTVIAASLGAYAANKAAAMFCREQGDITGSNVYERICDDIYSRLPNDLKW
jgi:hypothetical protein